jgi:pyruvate dehydrogenase E2 component (dihydrolipoamide acetyltransferase)
MARPILMPKPGQMTEECVLTTWLKKEGDVVRKGDIVFEIETDKSAMEVEAFDEGVLLRQLVAEGQAVPVNAVCGWIGQPGEVVPDAPAVPAPAAAAAAPTPASPPAAVAAPTQAAAPTPAAVPAAAEPAAGARMRISPRAARAAADAGIDPRTVTGTGPEGRIVERDVAAAVAARTAAPAAAIPAPTSVPVATVAPIAPVVPLPVTPVDGEEEPRPLSRMRRTIAARLTSSWQTTPHFTVTVAVDVTRVLALRAELKAAGTNLTVTDFVLSATAQTLAEFPDVNSRTDGISVLPRRRVHLGVAVSVPAGLVVPVIRDADRLSLGQLHERAASLAATARDGSIAVDDLAGSTFTVSNLGMFGVEEFSAIINPGEAAILAVASAMPTPVAIDDGIAVRSIMRLTLSADHRLVDGETGARFLNAIRRRLEDVASFRREALNS